MPCSNPASQLDRLPVDINAVDSITPLGNVNVPDHTLPTDHMYVGLKKAVLYAKITRATQAPICGSFAQDVVGTAQGAWLTDKAADAANNTDWSAELSPVHFVQNPTVGEMGTHRVQITDPQQIDTEPIEWLRRALRERLRYGSVSARPRHRPVRCKSS